MRLRVLFSFLIVPVLAAGLLAACAAHAPWAMSPHDFAQNAWTGNKFEILSSELAEKRATKGEIRRFAAKMVKDHTATEQDLRVVLSHGDVPYVYDRLDDHYRGLLADLKAAHGKLFDQKYLAAQVEAHDEATGLFRAYAGSGTHHGLRKFAQRTLPTLEHHQDRAHALATH